MTDFQWEPTRLPPEQTLLLLQAISHPIRSKILRTLVLGEPMRVSDVAAAVGEAPNSVSYHLRQLEKAGITTRVDPVAGHDGRETWWAVPDWHGIRLDIEALHDMPGGPAVLADWDRSNAEETLRLFSMDYALASERTGWDGLSGDGPLRLDREEANALVDGIGALIDRAITQSHAHAEAGDADVHDYDYRIAILPRPDAASDSDSPPADEPAPDR